MKYTAKDDFDLETIAKSGQCFRFIKTGEKEYKINAFSKVLTIKDLGNNTFDFDCSKSDFDKIWSDYFDLKTNYSEIRKMVKGNDFLEKCAEYSKGMRMLKQDKWEMLISFIISQRKSIPAIQTSIERMSKLCGQKIDEENYAFPTPVEILSASVEDLASCGLGYRLDYILKASQTVYGNPGLLDSYNELSDDELFAKLKEMQGVGDKVASCISLFGYHRLNFFPKDVWINRALSEHFPNGYDFSLYAPYNGVVQQYIFFAYRNSHK